MAIKGNYWLDLIAREKEFAKEIESTVKKLIGKRFHDYPDLAANVKEAIRIHLENYGVKHRMGLFHLHYDIDFKYDKNFILTGYDLKNVQLDDDAW